MVLISDRIAQLNGIVEKLYRSKWGKFVNDHKIGCLKLAMVYFFFLTTMGMILVYAFSYAILEHPFVTPLLGDYNFHKERAETIFTDGLNTTEYYAPLIHIILGMFADRGVDFGVILFIPIIVYFVLPMSFYKMAKEYHGSTEKGMISALLYFFTYNSMFYVFNGTYAQALNAVFLCAIVYSAFLTFKNEKGAFFSLVYFTLVGIFTHPKGGLFGLVIMLFVLLIKLDIIKLLSSSLITSIAIDRFPFLIHRAKSSVGVGTTNNIAKYGIIHAIAKLAYFLNPFTIYYGMTSIRKDRLKDVLLLFVIIVPLLLIVVDSQMRTILVSMMFLNVFAGAGVYKYFEGNQTTRGITIMGLAFLYWILTTILYSGMLLSYIYFSTSNIL